MTVAPQFLDALHPCGRATKSAAIKDSTKDCEALDAAVIEGGGGKHPTKSLCAKAAGVLAEGGIVFAIPPRGRRRSMIRGLRAEGLERGGEFLLLNSGETDILCPFDADAIRFMRQTWPVSPRWRAVEIILRQGSGMRWVLLEMLPRIVLVAHAKWTQVAEWLAIASSQQSIRPLVVTSWRGAGHGAVAFGFSADSREPLLHAKTVDLSSAAGSTIESETLHRLWQEAVADRPAIPRPMDHAVPGWQLQTVLAGRPLSRLLSEAEISRDETVELVSGKLLRWNLAERSNHLLDDSWLETSVFGPLRELESSLPEAENYSTVLGNLARRVIGQSVSSVVAHNDCTTANCLWDPRSGLALVDWETCDFDGLPLADIVYSACDIAHSAGPSTRLAAFQTCFVKPGRVLNRLSARAVEWQSATSDPWEWLVCSFHACWLHHARNEKRKGKSGPRPFQSIVQEMAGWKDPVPPFLRAAMQDS